MFLKKKTENNRLKKSSWPKFCNIIFLFLLKIRSVGPADSRTYLSNLNNLGVCIPFCVNSVYIFFISSEGIGIFKINLAVLIQLSIEAFRHSNTWNLKHLRMRKLRLCYSLLHITYFRFIDMETWYVFET